jgi:hypothetical protein
MSVRSTGVARGNWLNAGTAREPVAVLGAAAAEQLGTDRVYPDQRIWLGGQWFNVAGVLKPSPLAPDIDNSALIGYPAAQKYLGYVSMVRGKAKTGPPSSIYVRAATGQFAEFRTPFGTGRRRVSATRGLDRTLVVELSPERPAAARAQASRAARYSAGCSARRPVPSAICSRQDVPGATTVASGAARTAPNRRRSPMRIETA